MILNSSHLEAFFACAQAGHFTKAAERLHITQSALSQRIKNLEEDLGTTLIIRDRGGLRLTDQGEELLRYCQTKEQLENQIVGSIKMRSGSRLNGVIRIGGYSSVMRSIVLPALSSLMKENPEVQIKMVTKELYDLRPMLKSGAIDFMILDEKLDQENLVATVLGYEESVMVKKRGKEPPEIYLDHDEEDQTTLRFLKRRSSGGIARHYLDDVYGIIDGVRLGLGYAVLSKHLIENEKDIVIVDSERSKRTPVVLHFYDQPFYSKLHAAIREALELHCPTLLGESKR
jgi:DNA-binding transcriptional LysR family regulator